eukprot:944697-Rhodomonas_salina.1
MVARRARGRGEEGRREAERRCEVLSNAASRAAVSGREPGRSSSSSSSMGCVSSGARVLLAWTVERADLAMSGVCVYSTSEGLGAPYRKSASERA